MCPSCAIGEVCDIHDFLHSGSRECEPGPLTRTLCTHFRFSDAAGGGAGHDLEGGLLTSARGSTGGGGLTARSGRSRKSSGRGAREKTGFDEWVDKQMEGFGIDEARQYLEV